MTGLVIDAGATLHLLSSRHVDLASDTRLFAPPLLWSEVLSALRAARWRGEIPVEPARIVRERLRTTPIDRFADQARLHDRAWEIADQLGWTKTYDAEYVALADILRLPLLTTDARLRRGVAHLVQVLGPADL